MEGFRPPDLPLHQRRRRVRPGLSKILTRENLRVEFWIATLVKRRVLATWKMVILPPNMAVKWVGSLPCTTRTWIRSSSKLTFFKFPPGQESLPASGQVLLCVEQQRPGGFLFWKHFCIFFLLNFILKPARLGWSGSRANSR